MAENEKGSPIRIGVSSCLLGQNVRYDGGHKKDDFVTGLLGRFVDFVPVCPEVEVGMSIPRPTIRLERHGEAIRLVDPRNGVDHTEAMERWAARKVSEIEKPDLCGYVLKKDSPSCGMERVRVYAKGAPTKTGRGIFAAALLDRMPLLPVEEEGRHVIGPGGEVVVKLWGRMEGTHRLVVDRDGKVFFPKIGSFYVAGKTFSEVKSLNRAKVSSTAEVSSEVSLGQMKGIRVSVIGEVRSPGWYNVSSMHTALQASFIAGGIKDIGSLRRIALRRGGKTVETIDLYDFLLKGDTRSDTTLLSGDTIFVPVVGKLVAITGEVRRPAIYELAGETTLLELVQMAGGFAPSAYKRRLQVDRLEGHYAKIVLDIDAEELESGRKTFTLSDGDIVRILPQGSNH